MFTLLACAFFLFALDGFFRKRTLYDDGSVAGAESREPPPKWAGLRALVWGALGLLCLLIGSVFEW